MIALLNRRPRSSREEEQEHKRLHVSSQANEHLDFPCETAIFKPENLPTSAYHDSACFPASFRAVRDSRPSRRTFFEHLRALIHYLPFDDGDHLTRFMLRRLDHAPLQQPKPSFSINPRSLLSLRLPKLKMRTAEIIGYTRVSEYYCVQ